MKELLSEEVGMASDQQTWLQLRFEDEGVELLSLLN